MRRSNIFNVIQFEIMRNLKKPSFWAAALFLPLVLVGYLALIGFTGYNTGSSMEQGSDTSTMRLGVYDEAGYLVDTQIVNTDGSTQRLKTYSSKEQGMDDVKSDALDVFYYIPAGFSAEQGVEVYAKPDTTNIFNNYDAPIKTLLATSASTHVNAEDVAVLTDNISINTTNFSTEENSEINPGEIISKMIVPIIGLALFYVIIITFGNRLTTAMVEEKENRISEIILTSMSPKDLIIGKIVSLITLGLIQIIVLIIPVLFMYALGTNQNIIPADITITLDPYTIISTVLLLILSYLLFAAMCITIGTLVPTAKDAASFSGVVMILVIIPIILIGSFMSDAPDMLVYIMSYFPPTAPVALMLRNAFGTLPPWELILGLIDLALFSFLAIKLAVFVFRRTAIEFSAKINLRSLLKIVRKV